MGTPHKYESTGMKVVITDVSVFFDLYHLQILPEFFALDIEVHTTNFVYNEITHSGQKNEFDVFVRSKRLNIINITPYEEDEIRALHLHRANKSFPDKTILWKAIQLKCTLLTCDNKLRKEAIEQGLDVHGIIWVISCLINQEIITQLKGIQLLQHIKKINTRLPHCEIDELIARLK